MGHLVFKVQSLIPSDMYGANSLHEVVNRGFLYRVPQDPFFLLIYDSLIYILALCFCTIR